MGTDAFFEGVSSNRTLLADFKIFTRRDACAVRALGRDSGACSEHGESVEDLLEHEFRSSEVRV